MSSYIAIASQTLGSSASSVTFSSIPTTLNGKTLRDLVLVCDYTSNTTAALALGMNAGVTGNNVFARGNGSTATSGTSSTTPLEFGGSIFSNSSDRALVTIQLFDYAQTNKHKSLLTRLNVATGSNPGTLMAASRFQSTAAITSLTLQFGGGQTFQSASTFNLFGIEG
jgi:hypothetical protein